MKGNRKTGALLILVEKQFSVTQHVHCGLSSCNLFCLVKSQGDESQRTIQLIIQIAILIAIDIVALDYFSISVIPKVLHVFWRKTPSKVALVKSSLKFS